MTLTYILQSVLGTSTSFNLFLQSFSGQSGFSKVTVPSSSLYLCAFSGWFLLIFGDIFCLVCPLYFYFGISLVWWSVYWIFISVIERILILKCIYFSNIFREKAGDCVGNLIRVDEIQEISEGQYLHFFQRRNGVVPGTNLLVGDRVVVSGEENGLLGLATGYVRGVSVTKVSCLLGR